MYSRARLLSSLAAGTAVLALASSAWAIGIRLNHPDIDTQVSPGELKTGSLSIENPSDRDMAIDVYVQDWKFKGAGNGEKVFFPPGELSNSASKWITLNPARMTLPPFSKREVNYSIAVPNDPNLSGMYHSVIFYESVAGEAVEEIHDLGLLAGRQLFIRRAWARWSGFRWQARLGGRAGFRTSR